MAEVFEAELAGDLGFSRKVAIKRMLPDAAADAEIANRFLDEARIASRLHHANIVSVVDMGLLEHLPFQVLELVDGLNAHQLQHRAGGVLPLEVALIIASDIAHALDHAHTAHDEAGLPHGIVHRDVKPSNVMISWGGDVKLTDFGIAFARDRVVKTEAGLVPGTMGFIAPEQRTKSELDGRTDVFALGLTLHAMLTGYTPLQDITVEIAALAGQPIPVDAMLPAEIRDVISRAITPDRRDRLTAAQFADALGALLAPRLHRDSRGYLRAFLEPLRGRQPKAGGALDQLLGFDVVPRSEPVGDAPREYELRATVVAGSAGPAASVAANTDPDPGSSVALTDRRLAARDAASSHGTTDQRIEIADAPTRVPVIAGNQRRGRRRAWLVAGALVVGGASGFAAWQLAGRPRQTHAAHSMDAATQIASVADAAPPPDAAVVAEEAAADAGVVAVVAVIADRPDAGVRTRRAPPHEAPRGSAVSPPAVGTGFVQITGEDNIGAKVLVDNREAGYAPNKLEVPRGRHAVRIVRKDGTTRDVEIEVTEYHTVQHPLRPAL